MLDFYREDEFSRMRVLIKLFQKFAQVEGAKPSSPPQRRNFFYAV